MGTLGDGGDKTTPSGQKVQSVGRLTSTHRENCEPLEENKWDYPIILRHVRGYEEISKIRMDINHLE